MGTTDGVAIPAKPEHKRNTEFEMQRIAQRLSTSFGAGTKQTSAQLSTHRNWFARNTQRQHAPRQSTRCTQRGQIAPRTSTSNQPKVAQSGGQEQCNSRDATLTAIVVLAQEKPPKQCKHTSSRKRSRSWPQQSEAVSKRKQ